MKSLGLGVTVLLILALIVGVACCPPPEATPTPTPEVTPEETPEVTPEGTPEETPTPVAGPTWSVDDEWVWAVTYKGETNTWTEKVTAEEDLAGTNCYVVDLFYDPPIERVSGAFEVTIASGTKWFSVDNQDLLEYVSTLTAPFATDVTYTYDYTYTAAKWPLTVGAEWTVDAVQHTMLGDEPFSWTVSVEAEEDVTVAAGTFSCFKMGWYADGTLEKTEWYSTDVKNLVKVVDLATYDAEQTQELESYTVAP